MSKGTLQELGLKPEAVEPGTPLADLPEGFGPRTPALQPGTYRFKLPADLSAIYEKFDANVPDGPSGQKTAERIRAIFDQDAPLVIIQTQPGLPDRTGEPFQTRLTNVERWRDREHTIKASDLDYLLRAIGEQDHPGFGNNVGYGQKLSAHPGAEFTADVDLTYYCSDRRPIYALVRDEAGTISTQEMPGVMGNGQRLRAGTGAGDVQKDPQNGLYPAEVEMAVQGTDPATGQPVTYTAVVRGFNNLNRIRAS